MTKSPILPLEQADFELLESPGTSWTSRLEHRITDWSHAIVIRQELLRIPGQPIIPGRIQITPPAGRYEHIEIPTSCGKYVYFFMMVRSTRSSIDLQNGLDLRIMQYCDEVIKFKTFYPELGEVRYEKCRNDDPTQFTREYARDKFVHDFLDRTAIR